MSNVSCVQPQKNKEEYRGGKEHNSGTGNCTLVQLSALGSRGTQECKGHQEKRLSHWRKTQKAFLPIAALRLYSGGVSSPMCVKSSSWDRWNFCSPLPPGDACSPAWSQSTPWAAQGIETSPASKCSFRNPKSTRTFPQGSCCSTLWSWAAWRRHVPTSLCSEHRERCSHAGSHCLADQGCSKVRWWLRSTMWVLFITAPT